MTHGNLFRFSIRHQFRRKLDRCGKNRKNFIKQLEVPLRTSFHTHQHWKLKVFLNSLFIRLKFWFCRSVKTTSKKNGRSFRLWRRSVCLNLFHTVYNCGYCRLDPVQKWSCIGVSWDGSDGTPYFTGSLCKLLKRPLDVSMDHVLLSGTSTSAVSRWQSSYFQRALYKLGLITSYTGG